jgi:hypothetical protein
MRWPCCVHTNTFFRACTRYRKNEPLPNNGRLFWSISPAFTRLVTLHSHTSCHVAFTRVLSRCIQKLLDSMVSMRCVVSESKACY